MKYAVIEIKGSQYRVAPGDEILVDKLGTKKPNAPVLLLVDSDKVKIGKPYLKDVKLKLEVMKDEVKGKKISVMKYKAKSRYRRKIGFRPKFSRIKITSIS